MVMMNPMRWRLFDLFDIPVYVDMTFLILLFLFVNSGSTFVVGLMQALVLGASIVAHEYGHALTGRAFGCETSHITLSFIGGCASMVSMPRRGWQEFLVAIAGPAVSFLLCGLGWLLLYTLPVASPYFAETLVYLYYLNLVLGCFNLLPGFPMDGGRIFRSAMMLFVSRPQATLVAMWVGRAVAVFLGLSGLYELFNGGSFAFIRIFIAWMIWKDGYREYRLALAEEDFRRWTQGDFNARVSPPPYDR